MGVWARLGGWARVSECLRNQEPNRFCNAALAPLVTSSSRYGGVVLMRGRAKKAKIAYGVQTDSQYSMRPLHTTFGPGSTLKARGAYWFALVYTAVALGCAYVPLGVFS